MRQLYRFLEQFRDAAIASILSAISIVLIVNSDAPQVQVLRSAAVTVFASLRAPSHWISAMFRAREENTTLRAINMAMMEEVMQLRRMRRENDELRTLMGFQKHASHPLTPAEVVGKSYVTGQRTITLNVGARDSISVGMPVIRENGLVGQVIAVSNAYSIAMLATGRNFRVSARVARSRVDGIVIRDSAPGLSLHNVIKTADVRIGDSVVTSTFSNTFPPDIPIGIVTMIGPGDRGLFSRIDIRPHVDFSTLERVFVMRWSRSEEQARIERQAGVAF